ncbi:MAG: acyl-CoA dehydrogenase, partial [Gammaproteobacteria bacterium]|nr:acyl-CoA dehydrogenase [Gammaproteobacteria bacterium]
MTAIDDFQSETRAWLAANCPPGARRSKLSLDGVRPDSEDADARRWFERMLERGWTAPMWPTEYGGGGLSHAENRVLINELRRIDARFPLIGIAASVIGSTLLELGSEDQKRRHLPAIVRTERTWCQGYSEPGAGSDLASLQTRAEVRGDHFAINGRKIWTSGAHSADWMYALVRTDVDAPKHEGISFVLLDMHQPG